MVSERALVWGDTMIEQVHVFRNEPPSAARNCALPRRKSGIDNRPLPKGEIG